MPIIQTLTITKEMHYRGNDLNLRLNININIYVYIYIQLSLNKFNEAIKCYNTAIEIDPEYADAYYNKVSNDIKMI